MTDIPDEPTQPPAAPPPPPPPPPSDPWGQAAQPSSVQRSSSTNGFAVASLVLGIAQIFLCFIGGILALVFGYVGRNQIDQSGGTQGGRGLAVAGIVLGYVGIGIAILWAVVAGISAATS